MRTLTLWLALGVLACIVGAIVVTARADARHTAAGWPGDPPRPRAVLPLAALALLLWVGTLAAGVASVLTIP